MMASVVMIAVVTWPVIQYILIMSMFTFWSVTSSLHWVFLYSKCVIKQVCKSVLHYYEVVLIIVCAYGTNQSHSCSRLFVKWQCVFNKNDNSFICHSWFRNKSRVVHLCDKKKIQSFCPQTSTENEPTLEFTCSSVSVTGEFHLRCSISRYWDSIKKDTLQIMSEKIKIEETSQTTLL